MALSLPAMVSDPATQQDLDFIAGQFPLSGVLIGDVTIEDKHIVKESIEADKLKINELSAITANLGTVTAGLLEAVTVKGGTIIGGTLKGALVEGNEIKGGTIEGVTIKGTTVEGGTIKGGTIEGGTVKGAKLEGNTIEGGEILGAMIIGGTIETAKTGARVVLTSAGIVGYNAAGKEKFHFDTATGILLAEAVISLEEGSVIPTKYLSGQITETQITKEAISTPLLAANSVTAAKISVTNLAAINVNAGKITAGEIQAGALSISTLSAISANLGSITAGTITGATFRTSAEEEAVFNNKGLKFSEGSSSLHSIDWLSEGTLVARIYGQKSASAANLILRSEGLTGATTAKTNLGASGKGNPYVANLLVESWAEGTALIQAQVAPEVFATILNSNSESGFLQLTETAKRKINFGEATLEFPGGSQFATAKTIEHGLGATPESVQITSGDSSNNTGVGTFTSTKFTAAMRTVDGSSPAAGTKTTIYWIAVG